MPYPIIPERDGRALPVIPVDGAGNPSGGVMAATSANVTTVAASTTSVQILATNSERRGLIITNATDMQVRIKYGTAASATSYTVLLAAGAVFEAAVAYRGIVTAISPTAAAGNYHVTELI